MSFVSELMFAEGQAKGYRITCQPLARRAFSHAIGNPTTCKLAKVGSLSEEFLITVAFPVLEADVTVTYK